MIKAQLSKEKLKGVGLMFGVEFSSIKVQHPRNTTYGMQPTLTIGCRLIRWAFYLSVYRPANLKLNRKERRAIHFN